MFTPWILLGIITVLLVKAVYVRLSHPLLHVPPIHWSVKWCNCYNIVTKYAHSIRYVYYDAHLNSGGNGFRPLIRTGLNEVSVMTTEGVKTVFGGDFDRTSWYSVFWNFGKSNMFSTGSSKAHTQRRKILATSYSKTNVSQSQTQEIIKDCVKQLVNFIGQQTSQSKSSFGKTGPVVVRNAFRALQADIFTAFTFSKASGTKFLDNLQVGGNTLEDMEMEMIDLCHDERRDKFFFWESEEPFRRIVRFVKPNALKTHVKAQNWLSQMIARYEAEISFSKDAKYCERCPAFFQSGTYKKLLLWRSPDTGKSLEWDERASEIMDHMAAGQDAVPAALEFIVRKLSMHVEIQTRLQAELLNSICQSFSERTYAMIDELPFLNAVIMESLRLVDTISSYQTRIVPPSGCKISGYYIPGGTVVSAQPYLINRQHSIFPNPETFEPSRWLLPRESYRALAESMWTYSSGPRACIGKELSLAIIKTLIFEIYTNYKTSLLNEDRIEKRPWEGANRMSEVQFEFIKKSPKQETP